MTHRESQADVSYIGGIIRHNLRAAAPAGAAALLVLLAFAWAPMRAIVIDQYEDAAFALAPSAERAFEYGERHFDAQSPALYDIDRAEYFFNIAAAKDPTLLYVNHELARISFLRGNFTKAMAQIDFQISMHGDSTPNSYYIRGLIEGYKGEYAAAARDYEHFLQFDPHDWAALNDYAWVLLKAKRPQEAVIVTARGLVEFPDNPWLLNTSATALFETGQLEAARERAQEAQAAVETITEAQWLHAYPGNDPQIAGEGITAFKKAAAENMHTIEAALASSTVQSR